MNKEIHKKAEAVIEKVRPYIQLHGGDVVLTKVSNKTAYLHISGACAHCELSDLTYNKIIGELLMKEVPEIKKINLEMEV